MSEVLCQRQAVELPEMHAQLRRLYKQQYPSGTHEHLYERLLVKLPETSRALVRFQRILQDLATKDPSIIEQLSEKDRKVLSMSPDTLVLRAHLDVGRDSVLSNDQHSIAHFDTQPPIVAHNLIQVAASEHPEALERMGCVFFDVDGTKTLVDCTSHTTTGKYLEHMAEFLCQPPAEIRQWLEQRGLELKTYSYAGDEFVAVLRSQDKAIEKETLDAFAMEVQKAIATDAGLTSFVSFDEPDFIMEYDEWTDADRTAYKADPSSMYERLAVSRSKLPDRFTPSVSYGSATFLDALGIALSPDTKEAKTLDELGVNTFRLMVAMADSRMKDDKRAFRANMTDLKWQAFLLRNAENRRLMYENEETKAKYEEIKKRYETVQREMESVQAQLRAVLDKRQSHSGNGEAAEKQTAEKTTVQRITGFLRSSIDKVLGITRRQ